MGDTAQVVIVAGATRGVGRGVARAFGERGAAVYCTGRSVGGTVSPYGRPETLEETVGMVEAAGGEGIPVAVDHTDPDQVRELIERVRGERGRLDVLVNGVAGEDPRLGGWGKSFWELDLDEAPAVVQATLLSHLVTAAHATPLMLESGGALIASITEFDLLLGGGNTALGDIAKTGIKTMMFRLAEELHPHGIAAVSATPGFLRSERMLEHFGVSEDNWRDAGEKDIHFLQSETPLYLGRGLAALAADESRMKLSGEVVSSWQLARRYGIEDADGGRPEWGPYFEQILPEIEWIHEPMRRLAACLERQTERAHSYLRQI